MNIEGGPACLSTGTEHLEVRSCPAVEFLQQRCSCIQWTISRSAFSTSRRGFIPLFLELCSYVRLEGIYILLRYI